jgi:hypothetical protein
MLVGDINTNFFRTFATSPVSVTPLQSYGLPNFKTPGRGPGGLRFPSGRFFPNRVRSIRCVVRSFTAFEKVKLYKARHFFEMTVARKPDLLKLAVGSSSMP